MARSKKTALEPKKSNQSRGVVSIAGWFEFKTPTKREVIAVIAGVSGWVYHFAPSTNPMPDPPVVQVYVNQK